MHLVVLISPPTQRRKFMISRIKKNAEFYKISQNVVQPNLKWSTVLNDQVSIQK